MKAIIDTETKTVEVTLKGLKRSTTSYFDSLDKPEHQKYGVPPYPVLSKYEWAVVNKAAEILQVAASRYNPPKIDNFISEDFAVVENITLSHPNIYDISAVSIVANIPAEKMNVNKVNGVIKLDRHIVEEVKRLDFLHPCVKVDYGFFVQGWENYINS